jgi:hypothetical protein
MDVELDFSFHEKMDDVWEQNYYGECTWTTGTTTEVGIWYVSYDSRYHDRQQNLLSLVWQQVPRPTIEFGISRTHVRRISPGLTCGIPIPLVLLQIDNHKNPYQHI